MATIAAIATAAVAVGGAVMQQQAAGNAASAARSASAAQQTADHRYRQEVQQYQLDVWAQDLAYAREVLAYSEDEFTKQTAWAGRAMEAATRNRDAEAFSLMARSLEEGLAAAFQNTSLARQGQAARASFTARERGVEGASVEAVLNDVQRQVGEGQAMTDINLSGVRRQLGREMLASDARADETMFQIASNIRSFTPSAPIRGPQPVGQPQAPQQINGPGIGGLAAGVFNGAAAGFNAYNSFTGQNAAQTWNQLSGWVGRQFSFGTTSSAPATSTVFAAGRVVGGT
jgi:hypothetical protein